MRRSVQPIVTEEQARAIAAIVAEECGATWGWDREDSFIRYMTKTHGAREWRLNSKLGFGGKVYLNSNRNFTPYVGCYREDETPERIAMIERTNERIASIWPTEDA